MPFSLFVDCSEVVNTTKYFDNTFYFQHEFKKISNSLTACSVKLLSSQFSYFCHKFLSFVHCHCGRPTLTFPQPIWSAFQMDVAADNALVQADAGVQFSHCSPMINQEEIS